MTDEARGLRPRPDGPLDLAPWPDRLSAFVVDPRRRIHGYAGAEDLALNYGFVDILRLSLCGELGTAEDARMIDAALALLAPVGVFESPGRSALLAQMGAGDPRAGIEVGWISLCERASTLLERHASFVAWLEQGARGEAPAGPAMPELGDPICEPAFIEHWRARCESLRPGLTQVQAALCLLQAAGLRERGARLLAISLAGIGTVVAEAGAGAKLGFKGHPGDLPSTRLRAPERRDHDD